MNALAKKLNADNAARQRAWAKQMKKEDAKNEGRKKRIRNILTRMGYTGDAAIIHDCHGGYTVLAYNAPSMADIEAFAETN